MKHDRLGLGLALSTAIGLAGYAKQSLTPSGVGGAMLIGTAVFGFGGWLWGWLLIAFFVSSSLLSRFKDSQKRQVTAGFEKSHQRDLGQALANGGVAALMATGHSLRPHRGWWPAFLGALATATADTWATELGVLSREQPRLITTGRQVAAGTSGGVTGGGTLAAMGGALGIGGLAWLLQSLGGHRPAARLILVTGFAGLGGALFDSLLGATVQSLYYSPNRDALTERRFDREQPNRQNQHRRGIPGLNNDWVNFLSCLFGAALAWWASRLVQAK